MSYRRDQLFQYFTLLNVLIVLPGHQHVVSEARTLVHACIRHSSPGFPGLCPMRYALHCKQCFVCLNTDSVPLHKMTTGREFHNQGPAALKDLSPKLISFVRGTSNIMFMRRTCIACGLQSNDSFLACSRDTSYNGGLS